MQRLWPLQGTARRFLYRVSAITSTVSVILSPKASYHSAGL
jgi:hypothetical protein